MVINANFRSKMCGDVGGCILGTSVAIKHLMKHHCGNLGLIAQVNPLDQHSNNWIKITLIRIH